MNETEIIIECPRCGEQCAVICGQGWDRDLAVCECGFEQKLETSTTFDYSE